MPVILFPYHQHERLPDRAFPLPADVTVTADVPAGVPGEGDVWARSTPLYAALADEVAGAVGAGSVPTIVSGDCLVAQGVLAGVQRAGVDASIVWFDAHGDVHTPESSTSGYLGGMALRFLLGAGPEPVVARLGLRSLPEDRAVLVDARDLDPAEVDYLARSRVRRLDVGQVAPDALPDGPLVLHVDLDVIDAGELPGLRFPVPGGPSTAAVVDAVRRVRATGRVVALSLAGTWYAGSGEDDDVHQRLLSALTT